MTDEAMILRMRIEILGDATDTSKDTIFTDYLNDAKNIFLNRVYPFNSTIDTIPKRYQTWQISCAKELYNSIGEEGYSAYSENNLSYSKDTDGISKELISQLPPPKAGVPL